MKTAILDIEAVDDEDLVGFREMLPTGPAGTRFGLYLPSTKLEEGARGYIAAILEDQVIDPKNFDYRFSYIHVFGDLESYNDDAISIMVNWMKDFPKTRDCRISLPFSLLYGEDNTF